MKLNIVYRQFTVRGEFQAQPFEADYSSEDGWNAGNGIQALNPDFADSDDHDQWHDELRTWLWENGVEAAQ
jgi:hypothetical protein